VHLERCLHDLRTTFAPGVELAISPPIVPFREGLAPEADGSATAATAGRHALPRRPSGAAYMNMNH